MALVDRSPVSDGRRRRRGLARRAWSRLHLWRRGSNMRTWLFTIMHNLHANLRRKDHRQPHPILLDDVGTVASTPASQEARLEIRSLADALTLLPEDQRAVLLLVGLEESSYQDAATILDIPVGTVMSRLHRGREKLRVSMAGTIVPALRRIK